MHASFRYLFLLLLLFMLISFTLIYFIFPTFISIITSFTTRSSTFTTTTLLKFQPRTCFTITTSITSLLLFLSLIILCFYQILLILLQFYLLPLSLQTPSDIYLYYFFYLSLYFLLPILVLFFFFFQLFYYFCTIFNFDIPNGNVNAQKSHFLRDMQPLINESRLNRVIHVLRIFFDYTGPLNPFNLLCTVARTHQSSLS